MTQEQKTINHLVKHGYITVLIAAGVYGNTRLAATINRLRTTHAWLVPDGHDIVTQVCYDDAGVKYTRYSLERHDRVTNDATVRPSARGRLLERVAA